MSRLDYTPEVHFHFGEMLALDFVNQVTEADSPCLEKKKSRSNQIALYAHANHLQRTFYASHLCCCSRMRLFEAVQAVREKYPSQH